jgi:hypothetical protein
MGIIETSTFENCTNLTGINIPLSIYIIRDGAFRNTKLSSVNIPTNTYTIGETAFIQCYSMTGISVSPSSFYYSSISGVLTNKNQTILVNYPIGKPITSYTVPNSITSIGNYAFYDANLTNVDFNNTTAIGSFSFSLSNIIVFSNNKVQAIGNNAFENCTNLAFVGSNPNLSTISYYAFSECTNLQYALLNNSKISILEVSVFNGCTNLGTVLLPNSLKSIIGSFSNCDNLIQIVIPKDVSSISSDSFAGCTRLARVYFLGDYPFGLAYPYQAFSIAQIYRLSFRTWPNLPSVLYPQLKLPIILDDFSSAKGQVLYIPDFYNNSIILSSGNGSINI